MEAIADQWRAGVVNFTKRNSLLFFRPKTDTIELSQARLEPIDDLLQGKPANLRSFFPGDEAQVMQAEKIATKLLKKQKVSLEELGVSPVHVAVGFCSWVETAATGVTDADKTTHAPLFLIQVEIDYQKSAKQPFKLKPGAELRINGVVTHAAAAAGISFDPDELIEGLPDTATLLDLMSALSLIEDELSGLQQFKTHTDVFLAAFTYQDEAIYRDLSDIQALMDSDLVRAIAGDPSAVDKIQVDPGISIEASDYESPESENLILDADASQSQVIRSALAGGTVVVEGPPGTGKSQTISNLLAECMAANKKVLFVAQKRAAITAVTSRLASKGLDQLILDLHDQHRGPQVAAQIESSFANMRSAQAIDQTETHSQIIESREHLLGFRKAVFVDEVAFGVTFHQLREDFFGCPEGLRPSWRLNPETARSLSPEDLRNIKKTVTTLASSGGLNPDFDTRTDSWNVNAMRSDQDVEKSIADARIFLTSDCALLANLLQDTSSPVPKNFGPWFDKAQAIVVRGWLGECAPKLLTKELDPEFLARAIATFDRFSNVRVSWSKRAAAKFRVSRMLKGTDEQKLQALRVLERYRSIDPIKAPGDSESKFESSWQNLLDAVIRTEDLLRRLQGFDLKKLKVTELTQHLASLLKDGSQYRIPRFWEANDQAIAAGFPSILGMLRGDFREAFEPSDYVQMFNAALAQTLMEDYLVRDIRLQGLSSASLKQAMRSLNKAESEHFANNAKKIMRLAAESFKAASDAYPDQSKFLHGEATKKRAHKPLRTLMARAPDLMLAANPIWAMSPIQAASYLPRKQLFDIVIFDEASQVKPEMAIPAIIRGKSVVIAGDSNQLPPTNFFSGAGLVLEALDEEDSYLDDAARDSESILEAAERVIGNSKKRLLWHYRSRDERLIALSNLEIYGNSLTTFPASDTPDAVRHVLAKPKGHRPVASGLDNNEIATTIDLIRDHSMSSPNESLGVITFGTSHLEKLEFALNQVRETDLALDRWLDGNGKEPFFIKNLERVQGDERDAIILFTGYGKAESGKISMQWGPLNHELGRRRLNVAISRAKLRMTLVSTFTSEELSGENIKPGTGVDLYLKFLEYMENEGSGYRNSSSSIALNPFELDIKEKMERAGLSVITQFGVGRYLIDFVIRHPSEPEVLVLAVEADGATYHSGHTARERDRLRQMALEDRGWTFHRIWSTDWFKDADAEVAKLLTAVDLAVAGSESTSLRQEANGAIYVADQLPAPGRSLEHPGQWQADSIDEIPASYLDSLVSYIVSDGLVRTNEEIMYDALGELPFAHMGAKIRRTLESTILRVLGK